VGAILIILGIIVVAYFIRKCEVFNMIWWTLLLIACSPTHQVVVMIVMVKTAKAIQGKTRLHVAVGLPTACFDLHDPKCRCQ
jgi:hypothetical protein